MSERFGERARLGLIALGVSVPARVIAWAALAVATGWIVRSEVIRPEVPQGVRSYTDVVYREVGGRRLRLDVYVPDALAIQGIRARRPAIVAIHGGGWRGGSRTEYGRSVAVLARYGFVVLAVDYRLSTPSEPSWPGNFDDVRAAVRWARRNANAYGIDPDRIAVLGSSAGGHLALLLGSQPGDDPSGVRAVVDLYGPTDLAPLYALRTNADHSIGMFLGGPPEAFPKRYEEASPLKRVTAGGAPVLIVHGTDDALVPLGQSQALADALGRRGVPHRLVTVPGARHGFGLNVGGRDLAPEVVAFLESVWGGPTSKVGASVAERVAWNHAIVEGR